MNNQQVVLYAQKMSMKILYCNHVTNISTKVLSRNKKKLLLITDQILIFFDSKKKQPYYWININFIQLAEKQIELEFQIEKNITKNVIFIPLKNDLKNVFGIIVDLLIKILVPDKIKKLGLSKYIKDSKIKYTGYSIMSHFLGYLNFHGIPTRENARAFLINTVVQNPMLFLQTFSRPNDIFSAILDVLPLIDFIEFLDLDNIDDTFDILCRKIRSIKNLSNLSINTTNKAKFKVFLKKFDSIDSEIEGFSFASLNLSLDEFGFLIQTIQNKNLSSLGFHQKSLSTDAIAKLPDLLKILSDSLKFLSFDNFSNIPLSTLFESISYITVLSLVNCKLQVNAILNSIFKNGFNKLSELDISGNICNMHIDSKYKFPPKLIKIIANQIDWKKSDYFISFLDLIFKKMNSILKISVSSATLLGQKDWNNVLKYLSKLNIDYNVIDTIVWDNNPVNHLFFKFLERCHKLKTLSLSSFSSLDDENNSIQNLCEYLSQAKQIETLFLRGFPYNNEVFPTYSSQELRNEISSNISEILRAILQMKSLRKLDISYNNIGDDGIMSLQKLISKNPISVVNFDGSYPSSLQPLLSIFELTLNMKSNCKLCFPAHDVYFVFDSGKASFDEMAELRRFANHHFITSNKLNSQSITSNTNSSGNFKRSSLTEPFYAYFDWDLFNDVSIPRYIKRLVYAPESPKKKSGDNDYSSESNDIKNMKKTVKNIKDDENYKEKDINIINSSTDAFTMATHLPHKSKKKQDESSDLYIPIKKRKKNSKIISSSESYSEYIQSPKKDKQYQKYFQESSYDEYSSHSPKNKKLNKYSNNSYDMKARGQPASLTKSSAYSMKTKGRRLNSPKSMDPKKIRKTTKKKRLYDYSDSSSSNPTKITQKVEKTSLINHEESLSNTFSSSEINIPSISIKNYGKLSPVKQRPPPSLGSSDEEIMKRINKNKKDKLQMIENDEYESYSSSFHESDIDDNQIKSPDWSFPLNYVPTPNDNAQIIQDLNEKYSVGSLLTYMKNA